MRPGSGKRIIPGGEPQNQGPVLTVDAHASANHEAYISQLRAAVEEKKKGWDLTPVSTARIYAELWPLIMNEDWCLASPSGFSSAHHRELWEHNKPHSYATDFYYDHCLLPSRDR